MLISTVRTCSSEPLPEEDAAFLTNAKVGGVNHGYLTFDGMMSEYLYIYFCEGIELHVHHLFVH